jgi:protease PrsW
LVKEFLAINNLSENQHSEKISVIFTNIIKLLPSYLKFWDYLNSGLQSNKELIILILIVITPITGLFFVQFPVIVYGIYGLYFASIWSLILYKTIATNQVIFYKTLVVFIGTILFSAVIISAIHVTPIGSFISSCTEAESLILRFITMFFGVAIIEEFCKQIFVYWIINSNKFVTTTRTAIFYGMIAGIAFGIFEGIEYQIGINKELNIDENYFFNILRLTSLPFFHAIWAGIGAYLISLSFILIKFKYSFRIIALIIPALFHALYNTFGLTIIGIGVVIVSFLLLIIYLTKSNVINNQLNINHHE